MQNLVQRNGVFYARYSRGGKEVWKSLRTKDRSEALSRLESLTVGPRKERARQGSVEAFSKVWIRDFIKLSRNAYNVRLVEQRLQMHILPVLGDIDLVELRRTDLRRLRNALEAKGLAVFTVRHILSDVRAMLRAAVEMELLEASPFSSKLLPKVREKVPQRLSDSQLEAILGTALPHWALLIQMGLYTGCRYGELRDLEWGSVRDLPQPHLRLGNTKSGKNRTVPLVPEALEVLATLREQAESDKVFNYRPEYADAFVRYSVRKVGFKWHFHQLRHTFCTRMLEEGYSKEMLRLWLGHSTIRLIETTYGHLTDDAVFQELGRVNPRLAVTGRKS